MTYSKLFSGNSELGNLPELICEIIKYFRNDFSTLYSCILVNRLWCRLAIPLLWEDPFSIYAQNFQFIEIYLGNLNEDAKQHLVDRNLIAKNCSSTLFNYPSFIKRLNTNKIYRSIGNWHPALMDCWTILVYRSLFKMFIENEGNLHSFEFEYHTVLDFNYLKVTMELTLQNPNFTCNIRNLKFSMSATNIYINMFPLLKFLCFNCNSISSFYIGYGYKDGNNTLIEKCLTKMFNTQQSIEKISFECYNSLYDSFSLLTNISNTLKIITFYRVDFEEIINNIQEIFNQLNGLETIHIIYCYSLNSDFVQQIINVIRPFKLKSLILKYHFQVESLQLLIQKFGSDLENFEFSKGLLHGKSKQKRQILFESIIEYCTKIKYFSLRDININLALNLIENIKKQSLNYLNIRFYDYYGYYESKNLKNLGQILPSKLEFLKLDLIKPNYLKIFLENFQDTFIKRLFIKIKFHEGYKDILSYIKEYIMKKKRVKYLAILINCQDLVSLKDEVKEFELYNIKVQKYDESYIRDIDIVNN
ncbi:unnamed protein product [Rhizophagus irregularis]|nr:unnamed protein product [Rhizophagus irregularis]